MRSCGFNNFQIRILAPILGGRKNNKIQGKTNLDEGKGLAYVKFLWQKRVRAT